MLTQHAIFIILLFATVYASVKANKLTLSGGITGGLIACCIYIGSGFTGIAMLGLFFLLGTLATSWDKGIKEKLGTAEHNTGKRTAGQVLANGGIAGLTGLLAYIFPAHTEWMLLMMAAGLSSATADTLSSELGTVY